MKKLAQEIIKLIIAICLTVGAFLTFKNFYKQSLNSNTTQENLGSKSEILKKYLTSNKKPQRIEIVNLSTRFEKDVQTIKQIKIAQDKNSDFYISIQFFTDENDLKAPLIAQIRFIDIKTGNTIKEESLNLD